MPLERVGKNYRVDYDDGRGGSSVVLGDENAVSFRPHVRLKRWGEEAYCALGWPTSRNLTTNFDGDVVVWNDSASNQQCRFYVPTLSDADIGGFEFELILGARTNQVDFPFTFESQGLEFLFQPPLDAWETARGNTRPDWMVGGYAVYHASKVDNEYRAGKAFELRRPHAIDALGNRAWCDWTLDFDAGTATITAPRNFLRDATYPVTIDPTVGYASLGASTDNTDAYALYVGYTTSAAGAANPGTAYYGGAHSSGATVYTAAYVWNPTTCVGAALIAASAAITLTSTAAFRSAAITWTSILDATTYAITTWSNTSGVTTRYDSGGASGFYDGTSTATPPATMPAGNNGAFNNRASAYVDYTASGGGPIPGKTFMLMGCGR